MTDDGGLSKARLGRLRDRMAAHVERGAVPGAVTLVGRRGATHVEAIGEMALGGPPMRRDTLFRVTSMTKPVTAVAALILVEECKLRLDDPVDALLPELADRRVLTRLDAPLDDTVPAKRPITLRDLLTFKLGFGNVFGAEGLPIQKAVQELQLACIGPPKPASPLEPDEWMRRFGTLPLMHQPGEGWMYNTGSYVLGVLVARAAGMPLEQFLRERIFAPLGMKDTGFSVPADQLHRLATSYFPDEATGALVEHDGVADSQWARPPAFPNGGAGLVSTADDFLAFGEMMLGMGTRGDVRILARPTVALMTTDHLIARDKADWGFFPGWWDARGWGFGVAIDTRRDGMASTPGRYGWDGGYGTSWYVDPAEGLVGILMTQRAGFPTMNPVNQDFWTSLYQAIAD
jgi:CubicO group peptidase (beta-lactamase class C family)